MLKPIKITYKGKDSTVEFEDALTFGETEALISGSVDLSDVTKPKINLASYRMNLLVTTIKKAPFRVGDITTIKMLDAKVVKHMLREITKIHPLTEYIEDWMETFQVYEGETDSSTESTTNVQPASGGTKKPRTNSQ
tara:strand:- start:3377 stop:3787 length:411 start_codon:yes stop_codon:yes gene_type:complete